MPQFTFQISTTVNCCRAALTCLWIGLLFGCGGNPSPPSHAGSVLAIEVVAGMSNRPVAGAEVRVLDPAEPAGWIHSPLSSNRLRLARRFGKLHRCDGQGRLRLPTPTEGSLLYARNSEGEAWHYFSDPEVTELQLCVKRSKRLIVEVVDRGGKPCPGVKVSVGPTSAAIHLLKGFTSVGVGEVEFRQLDFWCYPRLVDEWFISLPLVLDDTIPVRFPEGGAPSHRHRVTLPETGRIVVNLVGHPPEISPPFLDGLVLAPAPPESKDDGDGEEEGPCRAKGPFQTRPIGPDHQVVFSAVALNRKYQVVHTGLLPRWFRGEEKDALAFTGPKRAGETVTVTYRQRGLTAVRGRLVTPEGNPASGMTFRVLGIVGVFSGVRDHLITDEDGRFCFLANQSEARSKSVPCGLVGYRRPANAWFPLYAWKDLPPSAPSGIVDLGDLVLNRDPVILAGSVVDPEGSPIAGVRVCLNREDGTYNNPPYPETYSDIKGRFLFRAPTAKAPRRLTFRKGGRLPVEREGVKVNPDDPEEGVLENVAPGRMDLRLTMRSMGRIAGHLLVAHPAVLPHLQVEAVVDEEFGEECCPTTLTHDWEGRFRGFLPPGRARIRVRFKYGEGISNPHVTFKTLATLPAFSIHPGKKAGVPNHGLIDLRKAVLPYCVSVTLPETDLFYPGLEVEVCTRNHEVIRSLGLEEDPGKESRVEFAWPADEKAFLIRGENLRTLFFTNPPPGHRLKLRPGLRTNLALEPPLPWPGEPFRFQIGLALRSEPDRDVGWVGLPHPEAGGDGCHLHLPLPGAYRWTLGMGLDRRQVPASLGERFDRASAAITKLLEPLHRELHLADKESLQTLTIALPPSVHARLQKILETLH